MRPPFRALLVAALVALGGCGDEADLLFPGLGLGASPSPRPSGGRFAQPLASPQAFAFQPVQWVAQAKLTGDRLDVGTTRLEAIPAGGQPMAIAWSATGGWLLRTRDGGDAWEHVEVPQTKDLVHTGLSFVDANTGWLATQQQLYATTDGGTTWRVLKDFAAEAAAAGGATDPTNAYPIGGLEFTSATVGHFTKDRRHYRTADGGRTWTDGEVLGQELALNALAAFGTDVWLGGRGVSHLLPGEGWAAPAGKFRFDAGRGTLVFVSATEGWALAQPEGEEPAGPGGVPLYHTVDGGDTWTPHVVKDPGGERITGADANAKLAFADPRHGWLAVGPELYATVDGGATWLRDRAARRAGIGGASALAPLGPNAGWVVSGDTIFRIAQLP